MTLSEYLIEAVAKREIGKYDNGKLFKELVNNMEHNLKKCGFVDDKNADGPHYIGDVHDDYAMYDIYFKKWEKGKHDIVMHFTFQKPDDDSEEWPLYMKLISDGLRLYSPMLGPKRVSTLIGTRELALVDYDKIKKFLRNIEYLGMWKSDFENASNAKRKTPQTWDKLVQDIKWMFDLKENGEIK